MNPQTYIFFGPSGCGKDTQARRLMEVLKKKDPQRGILYIETGKKFREFSEENTYTAQKTKEVITTGGLMPVFLPIYMWTEELKNNFTGEEHLVFDGVSRRLTEANVLDSALKFYERQNPTVVSFEVSDEWATKLMKGRGRADDSDEEIKKRLAWYRENTIPAIEYFKNDSNYNFISIDGEHSIEEVQEQLLQKLGLS